MTKERGLLFKSRTVWENVRLLAPSPFLLENPEKNPITPQPQSPNNAPHPCSSGTLASGCLLESVCVASTAIGHVTSRAIRSYKHTTQYICEVTVPSFPVIIIISHEGQLSQPKLPRALGQSVHQLIPSFPQARPTGFFDITPYPAAFCPGAGDLLLGYWYQF